MDSSLLQGWPEPVIPVQSLCTNGISSIPHSYVKPPSDRPSFPPGFGGKPRTPTADIPIVDLSGLTGNEADFKNTVRVMSDACEGWGIFQVVNHGVSSELRNRILEVWRGFFELPMEEKLKYVNSPTTYEGYGSRMGVEKGGALDWGDYFFLYLLPLSSRNPSKWPSLPLSCRDVIAEYADEVLKVSKAVIRGLSAGLGLEVGELEEATGGEEAGTTMRVNYYPRCPQPELTLGLSSHSDPGALTVLMVGDEVEGLQIKKGGEWMTVRPVRNSFIVNIGDQIQVLSNGIYKSVEHRAVVNSEKERMSIAFFYNPKIDIPIGPLDAITARQPPLYPRMTYAEYRVFIRKKGLKGKAQVESLKVT